MNFSLKSQSGTSLVEFAIVTMLSMTLFFGIIDFARAIYAASVMQEAAQAGARTGLALDTSDADIIAAARNHMIGLDSELASFVISRPGGNSIEVSITYDFQFLTPIIILTTGLPTIEIHGGARMLSN